MPDKKPEVYKTEDEIKEEARLRRQREEEAAARNPKSGQQKKRENFWYHYKWHTVAGITALFLVCLILRDTVFRTDPDATVIMISEQYFNADELDVLQEKLEQEAWDRDGDGKVYIQINFIHMPSTDSDGTSADGLSASHEDYAFQMKLVTIVAVGTDPLYLLDEAAYDWVVNMGAQDEDEGKPVTNNVFAPLSVPADQFGLSGMRFYLRNDMGGKQEYYQYCEELLTSLDK